MNRYTVATAAAALLIIAGQISARAQQPPSAAPPASPAPPAAPGAPPQAPQQPQPYFVGLPLGLPMTPAADGTFNAISSNVKVFGAIYSAESCSYDPVRNLIVVPNRGVAQGVQTNNAWVSLLNH